MGVNGCVYGCPNWCSVGPPDFRDARFVQVGTLVATLSENVDLVVASRVVLVSLCCDHGKPAVDALRAAAAMGVLVRHLPGVGAGHRVRDQIGASCLGDDLDDICLGFPDERVVAELLEQFRVVGDQLQHHAIQRLVVFQLGVLLVGVGLRVLVGLVLRHARRNLLGDDLANLVAVLPLDVAEHSRSRRCRTTCIRALPSRRPRRRAVGRGSA